MQGDCVCVCVWSLRLGVFVLMRSSSSSDSSQQCLAWVTAQSSVRHLLQTKSGNEPLPFPHKHLVTSTSLLCVTATALPHVHTSWDFIEGPIPYSFPLRSTYVNWQLMILLVLLQQKQTCLKQRRRLCSALGSAISRHLTIQLNFDLNSGCQNAIKKWFSMHFHLLVL